MSKSTALECQFEQAMYDQVYMRVWRECGYRAERFRQMVCPPRPGLKGTHYRGGVVTAKKLLSKVDGTAGFKILDEKNRLDLSVESLILKPEWRALFTEDELRLALLRLEDRKRAALRRSTTRHIMTP